MRFNLFISLALLMLSLGVFGHEGHNEKTHWETPPAGMKHIGTGHGDIVVASNGEVYVSVEGGDKAGIQVYSKDGQYLRNVANAPADFHGFIIRQEGDREFIYGAGRISKEVTKMTLTGEVVLKITLKNNQSQMQWARLTAVDVADNGDIYIIDGYSRDGIFQFDKEGKFIRAFGGRAAPYKFKNAHKLAIDRRFTPHRLLVCDRGNKRLIHLGLDGTYLGEYGKGNYGGPSAIAFHGDYLVLTELYSTIKIISKDGETLKEIGGPSLQNNRPKGLKWNEFPPTLWESQRLTGAHGIALDSLGNLYATEWNIYGRLLKFENIFKDLK